MKKQSMLSVKVLLLCCFTFSFAQAETLFQALKATHVSNPGLKASEVKDLESQEKVRQAQSGWKPNIYLNGNAGWSKVQSGQGALGDRETSTASAGLVVEQQLYRGGKTTAQTKLAKSERQAQYYTHQEQQQNTFNSVAQLYFSVIAAQRELSVQQSAESFFARQLEASRIRFEAGVQGRTVIDQSQASLAQARSSRIEALGTLKTLEARYMTLVGQSPKNITFPKVPKRVPRSLTESVNQALRNHPSALKAKVSTQSAGYSVDVSKADARPTVSLSGEASLTRDLIEDSTDQNYSISLNAKVPLYTSGSVRSRIRETKHVASRTLLEAEQTRRTVIQGARLAWHNLQTVEANLTALKAQESAQKALFESVQAEASVGERDFLEVLQVQQDLLSTRSLVIQGRSNYYTAVYNLLEATGLLTAKALGL